MTLSQSELDALTALLAESLRARAGEVLSDLVIVDRARNAAQLLSITYAMSSVVEGPSPAVDRRMVAAYLVDRADQLDTSKGHWIPIVGCAHAIMDGEFDAAVAHGELDDPALLKRVDRWRRR